MSTSDTRIGDLYEIADLLDGISGRMEGTTVHQRKDLAGQAGRWVMDAVSLGALRSPRWSGFHGKFNADLLQFLSNNYALLFTEMVTWCRDNAALITSTVDVPEDLKRPSTYAVNDQITFDPLIWLKHGCPLFAELIRNSIETGRSARSEAPEAPEASDHQANPDASAKAGQGQRGVTQAEAAKAAARIVKAEGWLGIKPLAKRIGTTPTTMRKAVKGSTYLTARRVEHDKAKASNRKPREAGTGGRQPEPVSDGDVLDRLIAEQDADMKRDQRKAKPRRDDVG